MHTLTLDGLVLSRAEFLTLLAAINPPDLIAIDAESLIPGDRNEHKALITEGVEQLRARGLLSTRGDTHLINDELLLMAGVVGFPQMVTVLVKQSPEVGLQQFTYYLAEGIIIEFTMPAPDQYRLASLPSLALWRDRMAFVLPLAQEDGQPTYTLSLPQPLLTGAQNAAQNGQSEEARRLLAGAGVAEDAARALVDAMATPTFSGSLAFLRTEPPTIVAARDLAVVQGEESAWAIYQPEADAPITVRTMAGEEMKELLQELATSV